MVSTKSLQICTSLLVSLLLFQCIESSQRFCGQALSDALDQICVNGYNTKIKKSLDWANDNKNGIESELRFQYANSPFWTKIHSGDANLMTKYRGRRHGVYDECCNKGCTYNELLSYCL